MPASFLLGFSVLIACTILPLFARAIGGDESLPSLEGFDSFEIGGDETQTNLTDDPLTNELQQIVILNEFRQISIAPPDPDKVVQPPGSPYTFLTAPKMIAQTKLTNDTMTNQFRHISIAMPNPVSPGTENGNLGPEPPYPKPSFTIPKIAAQIKLSDPAMPFKFRNINIAQPTPVSTNTAKGTIVLQKQSSKESLDFPKITALNTLTDVPMSDEFQINIALPNPVSPASGNNRLPQQPQSPSPFLLPKFMAQDNLEEVPMPSEFREINIAPPYPVSPDSENGTFTQEIRSPKASATVPNITAYNELMNTPISNKIQQSKPVLSYPNSPAVESDAQKPLSPPLSVTAPNDTGLTPDDDFNSTMFNEIPTSIDHSFMETLTNLENVFSGFKSLASLEIFKGTGNLSKELDNYFSASGIPTSIDPAFENDNNPPVTDGNDMNFRAPPVKGGKGLDFRGPPVRGVNGLDFGGPPMRGGKGLDIGGLHQNGGNGSDFKVLGDFDFPDKEIGTLLQHLLPKLTGAAPDTVENVENQFSEIIHAPGFTNDVDLPKVKSAFLKVAETPGIAADDINDLQKGVLKILHAPANQIPTMLGNIAMDLLGGLFPGIAPGRLPGKPPGKLPVVPPTQQPDVLSFGTDDFDFTNFTLPNSLSAIMSEADQQTFQ